MEQPKTFCESVLRLDKSHLMRMYHDTLYGFPVDSDNELFARLVLEINQAGLSWMTILNKEQNFRNAYSGFEVLKVAQYQEKDIHRLLADPGIIRNKLKVNAAIFNAQKILEIQDEFGSFKHWLNYHHPMALEGWVKLFKKTFKFTGGEITNEFLMSTGYLNGAHDETCPVFDQVIGQNPMWAKK